LAGLTAGIGAVYFLLRQLLASGDPGYVVIGMGRWSAETSLLVAIAVVVVTFFLFYLTIRLIVTTLSLPRLIKRRGQEKRNRRSQQALIDGLLESAEGNWESAEKHLIRHAANSGVPLINYLTAARAAHFRGALDQRDEYLKLAHESMPDAELAIGLTKAELQLSRQQFEDALENLTQLEKIAPSHAAVLKLKHQAYSQAEDWEGIRRIIPQLHANKVMMEAEIKLLETETYSALLRQRAASRDAQGLRDLWRDMPAHIRKLGGIEQVYFAAMIESGAGAEIEPQLRQALSKDWGETLLVLYGCIALPDPRQQLAQAEENWLPSHRQDAVLLRVLGKLAVRAEDADKALQYLESSLGIETSVEAYQLMGDLMLQQGDQARACQYFRNGLLFASNEAVAQVQQNPTGE
jgi:HemY protein